MKNKIYILIGTFLLLVPFRLPISVLLINLFNYIATTGTTGLPLEVLKGNVLVTKGVYAFIMAVMFQYNLWTVMVNDMKLGESHGGVFAAQMVGGCTWLAYIIYDMTSTGLIFDMLNKIPS